MTVTRRFVLAATLPALGGCMNARAPKKDTSSAKANTASLSTPLGRVELRGASVGQWRPTVIDAAARVAQVWGATPETLHVVACASADEFDSVDNDLDGTTAAVTVARGVFLGPDLLTSLTPTGREVVVAHELTHAALKQYGTDRTAAWVKEGAAEWTAQRSVRLPARQLWPTLAALAPEQRPSGPPSAAMFSSNVNLAYETAAAFCTYAAQGWGLGRWRAFVRSRPTQTSADAAATRLVRSAPGDFSSWLTARLE